MILLDTNAFIYLANGTIVVDAMTGNDIAIASITRIEAVGFSRITLNELNYPEALFEECGQMNLAESVIQKAIRPRQESNKTLVHKPGSSPTSSRLLNRAQSRRSDYPDYLSQDAHPA